MEKILKQGYIKAEDILMEPNPILDMVCTKVETPYLDEDIALLKIMHDHVKNSQNEEYATQHGIRPAVGIAAPQIGVTKRMIAIYIKYDDSEVSYALINPVIEKFSPETSFLKGGEGCLSVEEGMFTGNVPRSYKIVVRGYDILKKRIVTLRLKGFDAIVFQHELDHLEGRLFFERINPEDPGYIGEGWFEV